MEDVQTIGLNQIQGLGSTQPDEARYYLVFDKTGNCGTFFNYSGNLLDFNKDMLKVSTGAQSHADALESIRKSMVNSMRHGHCLIVNTENLRPNFRVEYQGTEETLPEWVWSYETLKNDYMKIVRPEENVD